MNSLPNKAPPSFAEMFHAHKDEADALDLLKRMLEIHPKRRITVEQALQHPFLESLHSPDDEPVNTTGFSFEFENEELSRERVQELIWEEIREYHADLPDCYPASSPRKQSAAAGKTSAGKGSSDADAKGAAPRADSKAGSNGAHSELDDHHDDKNGAKSSSGPSSARKRSIPSDIAGAKK